MFPRNRLSALQATTTTRDTAPLPQLGVDLDSNYSQDCDSESESESDSGLRLVPKNDRPQVANALTHAHRAGFQKDPNTRRKLSESLSVNDGACACQRRSRRRRQRWRRSPVLPEYQGP
ncbi:hypothetical protein ACLKA7_010724 [Drosophila subpalustris]